MAEWPNRHLTVHLIQKLIYGYRIFPTTSSRCSKRSWPLGPGPAPYWTINLKLIYFTFKTRMFWLFWGKTKIRLNHQQSAAGGGREVWCCMVSSFGSPIHSAHLKIWIYLWIWWLQHVENTLYLNLKFKQQYVTYLSYTSSGGHHTTMTSMTLRELMSPPESSLARRFHRNLLSETCQDVTGRPCQTGCVEIFSKPMCFVHVFFA